MEVNKRMSMYIKNMKKREIEMIKNWDLDDFGLVTERLMMLKSQESDSKPSGMAKQLSSNLETQKKKPVATKRNPKIPKLDFTRVYEIQMEQNMEYEEEEEEDEEENSQDQYGTKLKS